MFFKRLGRFVAQQWFWVILFWVMLAIGARWAAPAWDSITHDGDFAYMPAQMPSVRGEAWLKEAFPNHRAKSQIVIIAARDDRSLDGRDALIVEDLAQHFQSLLGASLLLRSQRLEQEAQQLLSVGKTDQAQEVGERAASMLAHSADSLDEAIELAQQLAAERRKTDEHRAQQNEPLAPPTLRSPDPYHNLAIVRSLQGRPEEAEALQAEAELLARSRYPAITLTDGIVSPADAAQWPLLDVWTPYSEVFRDKLMSKDRRARLIVLQLENEFMATGNIRLVQEMDRIVAEAQADAARRVDPGLQIGYSGSAAIGGDMLRSAKDNIAHTEWWTLVLVVLILVVVYRTPVLVAAPLATIAVSLVVSTSLVALLTQLGGVPGFSWWTLKVFTTSKIFIVVILFGAGTDYCLFLIARYREELLRDGNQSNAIEATMAGVGQALLASALPTIVGLGMMFFADFGKFKFSGPVIGLCLVVTLAASLTFTPALLCAFGKATFWPFGLRESPANAPNTMWRKLADAVVARPGLILVTSLVLMAPLAIYGLLQGGSVTYDFAAGLPQALPSRQGASALKQHFEVGESGPVTLLVRRHQGDLNSPSGHEQIDKLSQALYVPGVAAIRNITDPLGEQIPGTTRKFGVGPGSLRRAAVRSHRLTDQFYTPQATALAGDLARLEIVLKYDPFSIEAAQTLAAVDAKLAQIADSEDYWRGADHAYAGVTAAIADLRKVTQSDNIRIEWLVVTAVLIVLLLTLRRPVVCLYMIASVLLSYFVTLGASDLIFRWAYGPEYQGMDWKVPLFLFVILVAIGEDYNVYLATRVFEELKHRPPLEALRLAVSQTGGIITSCGVIMAGAFVSMTSSLWGPWLHLPFLSSSAGALPAIVELGFALALGVILDTFLVRPILLPAFLALWLNRSAARGPAQSVE